MASIEFTWDSRHLEVWRGRKIDKAIARALRLAGNQAIRQVQKASERHVRDRYAPKRSLDVKKGMPLDMPPRSDEISVLMWKERISGRAISLTKFPHIRTPSGVSVRLGGKTRRLKSAFIATMKSGHEGVFRRRGKGRLPIRELWAPRLSNMMLDDGVIPGIQSKAQERIASAFDRGLARELAKLRTKGDL